MAKNILEIKNLTFSFHTYGGVVKSVRDVSFNVREGEILGIVGESGCGKSVTSQCILKLNPEPVSYTHLDVYKRQIWRTRLSKKLRDPLSIWIRVPNICMS